MKEIVNTIVLIVVVSIVTLKIKKGDLPLPKLSSDVFDLKNMLDGDTIYIQGMGRCNNRSLINAKQIIQEIYGVPAKIISPIQLTNEFYSNNSIDSDLCLKKFDDDKNRLILTDESCYSFDHKTFVNGLGESNGNIVLINETTYVGLKRTIIHELGHNSGLEHCDNQNCVMSINRTNDSHTMNFCDDCRKKI